jgi:hypothetical protein
MYEAAPIPRGTESAHPFPPKTAGSHHTPVSTITTPVTPPTTRAKDLTGLATGFETEPSLRVVARVTSCCTPASAAMIRYSADHSTLKSAYAAGDRKIGTNALTM